VKQGSDLRAFEIKWARRRISSRAFREAYGVDVDVISSDNPFVSEMFDA